jgi:hypothetical protein
VRLISLTTCFSRWSSSHSRNDTPGGTSDEDSLLVASSSRDNDTAAVARCVPSRCGDSVAAAADAAAAAAVEGGRSGEPSTIVVDAAADAARGDVAFNSG